MKIVTIHTQKGGAGKTTLATNLCFASAKSGFLTLLIDADPKQKTALEWFNKREDKENPIVLGADDQNAVDKLIEKAKTLGIEMVFIDTQGAETNFSNHTMKVADIVLIPCSSSGFDIVAQRATGAAVQRLKKDASIILMKCPPTGHSEVNEAETVLSGLGIHINQNRTVYRKDYKEAAKYSSSVIEDNPEGKAALEIHKIFNWLDNHLNGNNILNEMKEATNG